jgi:hypothetical protein
MLMRITDRKKQSSCSKIINGRKFIKEYSD